MRLFLLWWCCCCWSSSWLLSFAIVTVVDATTIEQEQEQKQEQQEQEQEQLQQQQQQPQRTWKENAQEDFVLAGYLPEYRSYMNLNHTAPYLTDVILFSMTPTTTFDCCLESHHFQQAREARIYKQQQNHHHHHKNDYLNIWLSIGGAGRSSAFSQMVQSQSTKQQFFKHLIQFCQQEQIDGIDFDWEIPITKSENQYYYHFLSQAIQQLHRHNIMVSVALHPNQFLPPFLYFELDRIHLMTYDMMYDDDGHPHHASLQSMQQATKQMIRASGCPSSKIIVGIPAYGRLSSNPQKVKTYSEIVDHIIQEETEASFQQRIQQEQKQSSSTTTTNHDGSHWNGYYHDSIIDVKQKVDYAANQGQLGGVFFWELGQDKQYSNDNNDNNDNDTNHRNKQKMKKKNNYMYYPGGILLQSAYEKREEYLQQLELKRKMEEL